MLALHEAGIRTGMPQLVLMPAPVTITIFFALAMLSASWVRARASPGWTAVIGMTE